MLTCFACFSHVSRHHTSCGQELQHEMHDFVCLHACEHCRNAHNVHCACVAAVDDKSDMLSGYSDVLGALTHEIGCANAMILGVRTAAHHFMCFKAWNCLKCTRRAHLHAFHMFAAQSHGITNISG